MIKRVRKNWALLFLLIGMGIIALVLPFSSDDWMWGSPEGLRLLANHFHDYNGRIFSNLLMIFVSRPVALRVIVYAVSAVGLFYLVTALGFNTTKVKSWQLMVTAGLFMSMSPAVFGQTFGWLSGFINYIFGMIPLLLIILWLRESKSHSVVGWQCAVMAVLGFASALIVEHITLYILLLGTSATIYLFRRRSPQRWTLLCYLIGSIVGAFRMFMDPSYLDAFLGKNDQRHLAFGKRIFDQIVKTYSGQMYHYLFQDNLLIIVLLSGGLIWLIWHSQTRVSLLKYIVSSMLFGYSLLIILNAQLFDWNNLNSNGAFNKLLALSSLLFLGGVMLANALLVNQPHLQKRLWFYIVSALVLSAPFAVITPYGPRCAFGSVCFIVIATLDVWREVLASSSTPSVVLTKMCNVIGTLTVLIMVILMSLNGYYNRLRPEQMSAQAKAGHTEIVLQRLPFDQYNWNTTPGTAWGWGYSMMLKDAGLNPQDYHLTFVPFKNGTK
ncbi:DUF6056 family protein [Lacticaseibacillus suilingensis]|uniref:DUF6056 family protein n=1 Tax=Lacticaseibacillus suilingensis TaxID=2799577 RepID=UPI0022E3640F|nr:DUF6056 family protein [Lacticaseibacillus suilingensis]